jgi:hypothetical protein
VPLLARRQRLEEVDRASLVGLRSAEAVPRTLRVSLRLEDSLESALSGS